MTGGKKEKRGINICLVNSSGRQRLVPVETNGLQAAFLLWKMKEYFFEMANMSLR